MSAAKPIETVLRDAIPSLLMQWGEFYYRTGSKHKWHPNGWSGINNETVDLTVLRGYTCPTGPVHIHSRGRSSMGSKRQVCVLLGLTLFISAAAAQTEAT